MNSPRHADIELRIFHRDADGNFPVQITVNQLKVGAGLQQSEFPMGSLPGEGPGKLLAAPAEDVPGLLYAWLLDTPTLLEAWTEISTRYPLRAIRLHLDPPELHAIPWELMRDRVGDRKLEVAAHDGTPLFRYLPGRTVSAGPVFQRPLRILVAAANPAGLADWPLPAIDPAEEVARVRAAVAGTGGVFEVVPFEGPVTLAALTDQLRAGIHVLHLAAHGLAAPDQPPALVFEGADGEVEIVSDDRLATALASVGPSLDPGAPGDASDPPGAASLRLVLLLACRSGASTDAMPPPNGAPPGGAALRGVAPALVRAGVPAVVAMQDAIPHPTASTFANTFYTRLAEHGRVDLAVNQARAKLRETSAEPGPRLPAFAIPCLYSRLPGGQLLGMRGQLADGTVETERFWRTLVRDVEESTCVPFLGPRVRQGVLPSPEDIAETLARHFSYPFNDARDLARVAQSISLIDREDLLRTYLDQVRRGIYTSLGQTAPAKEKASLEEVARRLNWGQAVLGVRETTIFHHLAEMPFPIYITCDPHPLLTEALRYHGRTPTITGPRWDATAGHDHWLLAEEPTVERPLVVHLNGHDGTPEERDHLVLSEDDWFEHIIRLATGNLQYLPMQVQKALSTGALLLLGFEVQDWAFRVLFHTLFKWLDGNAASRNKKRLRLSVQLDTASARDEVAGAAFLREYLNTRDIKFYAGHTEQFVAELADHLHHGD